VLIAAIGVTAGTVHAEPAATADAPINFTAHATDTQSIINIDAGSMVVEDGAFKIKAANGDVVAGTPLTFRIDEFEFPMVADIADHTATLTPQIDMAKGHVTSRSPALRGQGPLQDEYDREVAAFKPHEGHHRHGRHHRHPRRGLGGGQSAACSAGIAGATVSSAAIIGLFGAFIPAAAIGCLGGIIAVGALGALAGQILITVRSRSVRRSSTSPPPPRRFVAPK